MTSDMTTLSEPFPRPRGGDTPANGPGAEGAAGAERDLVSRWQAAASEVTAAAEGAPAAGIAWVAGSDPEGGRPDDSAGSGPGDGSEPGDGQDAPRSRRRLLRLTRRSIRGRLRRPSLRGALVSLLVVALAVAVGVLGWDRAQADRTSNARTAASRAATAAATSMANYSYKTLSSDLRAVENRSTPAFSAQYKKSSASLAPVLQKYKATSTGSVAAAAVQSGNTSKATVLLFVDQSVQNSTTKKPTAERTRMVMTLLHQHGRWLVSDVTVK